MGKKSDDPWVSQPTSKYDPSPILVHPEGRTRNPSPILVHSKMKNQEYYSKINQVLENPTTDSILSVFEADGYIRLNMVYISPLSLKQFKYKMLYYSMINWSVGVSGMSFVFRSFRLRFNGPVNLVFKSSTNKIFCMEIDFDPSIDDNSGFPIMKEIEAYLKGLDAIFFMSYFVDVDKEILKNPLNESVEYIYKKNRRRKGGP